MQSWNIWRILQVSSRMQLTGCSSKPWQLKVFYYDCSDLTCHHKLNSQLQPYTTKSWIQKQRIPQIPPRMQLTDNCSPFFSKTVSSNFFLAFFLERGCIFEAPCKSPSNGPAENLFAGSEEGCMAGGSSHLKNKTNGNQHNLRTLFHNRWSRRP